MKKLILLSIACAASACSSGNEADQANRTSAQVPAAAAKGVVTSGKTDVPLSEVPEGVLAAARAQQPNFTATEAEAETRDGRRYFDLEGTLPDGSEVEFDIMEENGVWRVVETQRDIAFTAAPELVRAAHAEGFAPNRVIESTQADGVVIYELFGEENDDPEGRKVEIKWDGRSAEVLKEEWAH